MARLRRLAIAGLPHLVVHRGNGVDPVFRDDIDRQTYLNALTDVSRDCRVDVHAFAFLDHEVRLLATPGDVSALSRLMQRVGRRYVAPFNRRHQRAGAVWQGRFQAAALAPADYLMRCVRWVEQGQPPGAAPMPFDSPWSSAAHHIGVAASALVRDPPELWQHGNTPFERQARHRAALHMPVSPAEERELVAALKNGWPLGPREFFEPAAASAGRRVFRGAVGRPKGA